MNNKVKPKMIQFDSEFYNDWYLGCPICKSHIHFPLVRDIENHKPEKCTECESEFDWKGIKL